ncbi:L-ascorbate metabolism protein UlaG (beta-lactamase superfamily) [Nocardioides salarius]|uniref:L-ascorbate metabolism protein UlaG (Beta-lactamase superfamily) n=1 Tax=Nocardioides salarius TaxID=374513 RepID=A0ABS2MGQ6_9ACTN|nr:MBL fold metallo-hydrolase [Nocardioides salarius]MBM7510360.1 L-ascorbate metabolism protein UlaG (beta-lactamase superfamily) [Nocardioides salarius]
MDHEASETTLRFVGTATTLLDLGPFTVLTDPNFLHQGQRAYLGKGLFARRLTEPALQPEDLPRLDGVLLSHLHGDHFDRVARRALDRSLPVWTTPAAARRLGKWGFDESAGMSTWESVELERDGWRLRITSVPGVHGPGPARFLLPSVMGSVLELSRPDASRPFRLYVSGDTLYRPWLREVVERCGPLDAAVVHLGGTRVLGLTVTMDDRQGVDLVRLLGPAVTVPVHHDDYGVFRSPLSDFVSRHAEADLADTLRLVERGATVDLGKPAGGSSAP